MLLEQLLFRIDEGAAKRAGGEKRVESYKVKLQYEPIESKAERAAKRYAVAKVVARTFRKIRAQD